MRYQVIIPRSVRKKLDRFPASLTDRILEALAGLETDPRPPGCKKLRGREAYRVRVGDYRIIYEIHDRVLQVLVITVGHRREVYR